MEKCVEEKKRRLPRINFRILVFCAFGLVFGIFLCFRITLGSVRPSDFLFCLIFLGFALFPLSLRRVSLLLGLTLLFGGIGAGTARLYTKRYLSGPEEGTYFVAGTVASFTVENGRSYVLLESVSFDGASVGGKFSVTVDSELVRAGDILAFEAKVKRYDLPMSEDSRALYHFYRDIRYTCADISFEKTGTSGNFLLRISSALYDRLDGHMGSEEAQIAYALLTGNSGGMDEGLLDEVRTGGIAHIFAVSGLHIGILFGAVLLLFRKKRWGVFPAIAVILFYSALCAFTVSSVRAVVMCAVLGAYRAYGRKYDFLQSISLAAIVVLLIDPADFLSVGFRLSFGACLGLALFSGSLSRLFAKIPHLPRFLTSYLSANLAVQLFTLPILWEAFGFFSVWGFVLNLFLIPLLPVFFLTVLIFSVLALIIPPAAGFFLVLPRGLLSLFLLVISAGDFSFVLTGLSLGAGGTAYLIASLILSERFRLRTVPRLGAAAGLLVVFALCIALENIVPAGVRIDVYTSHTGSAALVRTTNDRILILDGGIGVRDSRDFLARTCDERLDAVFVLSEEELSGINRAVYLSAEKVYAYEEIPTGLMQKEVTFGKTQIVAGMKFCYETRSKLTIEVCGAVIEVDLEGEEALGADLFIGGGQGGLKYFLRSGIIKTI